MQLCGGPGFIAAIFQLNTDGEMIDPAPSLPAGLAGMPGGVCQVNQLADRPVAFDVEVCGDLAIRLPE